MPAFSKSDEIDLLFGKEMNCISSNVQVAQYDGKQERFIVGFGKPEDATLSFYTYTDVTIAMVEAFAAADSQGVWVSRELVKTKWPFIKGVEGVDKLHRQSET